MRVQDFQIVHENLDADDFTLVQNFYKSRDELKHRKISFKNSIMENDDESYLDTAVSRLYYEFAKEEHQRLLDEIKKRNLIID